jgi:SAM-dependent methyltransferase
MNTDLPNAPATERNRDPILAVLREHFADRRRVLEIGSGTGQHAVYFAAAAVACSSRDTTPSWLASMRAIFSAVVSSAGLSRVPPAKMCRVNFGPAAVISSVVSL